jgi:signal transduction histidine kinase
MGPVRTLAGRIQALVRRFPFAADAALAVALAVAALISLAVTYGELPPADPTFSQGFTLAVVASMLGITLPLAWRRRYPLSVGVVVVVAFLLARIVVHVPESQVSLLAAWLMIYSIAAYGRRPLRTPVLALCLAAIIAELVRELFFAAPTNVAPLAACFTLLYNVVVLALPWLLGSAIRSLRDRQRELAEQTVELQAEREENARQAVFAERVRIARELHDVVAHHVSVIGVQAAGARRVMERDPALAAEALGSIEASSRQAVVELHRLLGFLRRSDDVDGLRGCREIFPSAISTSPVRSVDGGVAGHGPPIRILR